LLFAFVLLATSPAQAGGGDDHTHGDETPVAASATALTPYFSVETASDKYEVLLRYDPIHPGEATEMTLFVSNFISNQPIGKATLQISSPEDANLKFTVSEAEPGIYNIATTFPKQQNYALNVSISGALGPDLLQIKPVEVGKELPVAEAAAGSAGFNPLYLLGFVGAFLVGVLLTYLAMQRRVSKAIVTVLVTCLLPATFYQSAQAHEGHDEGGKKKGNFSSQINVPKETQFLFDIVTQKLEAGEFSGSVQLFGTVIPSSTGQAVVSAPQNGRITSLRVKVGQKVAAGQTLAVIEQNIEATSQIGLLTERNALEAEYEAARAAYERLKSIEDIAARRDVDEAKARLDRAQRNLQLLKSSSGRFITLKSPINGTVQDFTFATGATVSASEPLFTINNIGKVYVEAQVYDQDIEKVYNNGRYIVECADEKERHKTAEVRLIAPAQTINPTNQSQRVLFEMDNRNSAFKIGEFVNVRAFATQPTRDQRLPNSAITEVNGRSVVFIKDSAEHYSMSFVQLGENNGTYTVILKGSEAGERIVTNGAYQMKMMYLNQ
jgi:RND family efflux transporter MFP subunit